MQRKQHLARSQEAASAAAAAREELNGRERTYLGDVMTDFEATFYRGNRNRVRDDIAEEGDYDEEQEDEERERETVPRQRRRSSTLKRAHWASVGQNGGTPPSIPSVGGANDPFLAGILEQARVRDAALAEQAYCKSCEVLMNCARPGRLMTKPQENSAFKRARIYCKQARVVR